MNYKSSYVGVVATMRTFITISVFALLFEGNAQAQSSLVWTGATDAKWDTATQNWTVGAGGAASAFSNGDSVLFDDTSSTPTVSIPVIVSPGTVTVDVSARNLILAPAAGMGLSGAMPLIKKGTGTLTLSATNAAFTGTSTVEEGVLAIGHNAPSNGTMAVGPVVLAGGTLTTGYSGNRLYVNETIVVPADKTGVFYIPRTFRYNGAIQGSGTLNLDTSASTAAAEFSANFTDFHGEVRITGTVNLQLGINETVTTDGTVNLFPAAGMADTSLVVYSGTIVPIMSNNSNAVMQIGALSGNANFSPVVRRVVGTLSSGKVVYKIGEKNLSTTFEGAISGTSASIEKVGTGTLTLAGVNTYTGTTTVTAGGLHVTGQLANTPVSVAADAGFGGSGTVAGAVTFAAGATLLADTTSAGALNGLEVTGAVSLDSMLTVTPVVADGDRLATGVYTVLHATGGITGTPAISWAYAGTEVTSASFNQTADTITVTITAALPDAPAINSMLSVAGTVGAAFNYTITASNNPTSFAATGLPAGLDINTTTGVISGTPTNAGTTNATITATNAGGSDSKTLEIIIAPPSVPVITSTLTVTGTIDAAFSYQIIATNAPTTYGAAPLPAGLSVDTSTGLISGALTPAAAGSNSITLSVSNATGNDTATLTLNAYPLPTIPGSPLSASGTVGETFSYSIADVATGDPTSYGATGLPAGLTLAAATGIISGMPESAGTTTITVSATNQVGVATAQLQLDIAAAWTPLPTITSELTATGTVGVPFTYQIVATNSPTAYAATELPDGLVFNENTGLISGTPTASGLTNVYIAATNSHGTSDTVTLALSILAPVADDALLWTGTTDHIWDKSTVNWTMAGLATNYDDGDHVVFNDMSTTGSISIAAVVAPASVTVEVSARTLILTPASGMGLSGAMPLIKKGSGTLTISATNTAFTGTTTIEAGVLRLGHSTSNADLAVGPVILAGGTLTTGYATTGARSTATTTIIVPEGKQGAFHMPALYRFNGSFQGSGTLVLHFPVSIGTSVAEFGGNFTGFHGELHITGTGVGNNLRLPINDRNSTVTNFFASEGWADTALVFNSGAITPLMLNNTSAVLPIGSLSGTGQFNAAARNSLVASTGVVTYRIGAKNIDTVFDGAFHGDNISVEKVGSGILTLGGMSTHSGSTAVTAGSLRVTGQLSGDSAVTVATGAALGGSGKIAGTVTYAGQATLLVDADASGSLSGLKLAKTAAFAAGSTITVTPVVPVGVEIVNGTYTIFEAEGGFSGVPAFVWSYPAAPEITAEFSVINSNKLEITIAGGAIARPVISSALKADGLVGQAFQYEVIVSNDPASPTQLTVTGLDGTGLSFDSASGIISGTPGVAGRYNVTLAASNSSGTTTETLEIIIYGGLPSVPLITSDTTAVAVVGSAFVYNITADNDPTGFDATGLPAGFSINTANGEISGISEAVGVSTITLIAKNIAGSGSTQLELTVSLPAPEVTSPKTVTVIEGAPFSYQITASNDPLSFSATGFPVDFTIDASSGLVTGTYTTMGEYTATVSASNLAGTGTETIDINVLIPAPVIQSDVTASGMVGASFSYQIDATNSPTRYAALGLPKGLIVDTATGLISGIPEASGSYSVNLVAINTTGPGSQLITIVISGESGLVTLAGSPGAQGSSDGSSTDARFNSPSDAAIDASGNLYVADTDNNAIRKIADDGTVTTFATGLNGPAAIVIDAAGTTLYVANANSGAISKIDIATKAVTALAITGTPPLNAPHGLAIDASGNLYVADAGDNTIRKIITSTGAMTTVAGASGTAGFDDGVGTTATFSTPTGLALDADYLYVADTNNSAIRRITLATGAVETLVTSNVTLNTPQALAIDAAGNLYVADTGNNAICSIDPATGIALTVADSTVLNAPGGIAIDSTGDIYVINTGDHTLCVLEVGPYIITQPAGRTVNAYSNVTFSVAASGAPTPTYQWYKDGFLIAGATESTYTIDSVQRTDVGNYSVIATNPMGAVQSNLAVLVVNGNPSEPSSGGMGGGGGATGWLYLLALAILLATRALRRWTTSVLSVLSISLFLAAVIASSNLAAQTQSSAVITGKVSSQTTGLALISAEVTLNGDGKTTRALTETDGTFRFGNLAPGSYTVRVAYAELDPQTRSVTVETGGREMLDFLMGSEVLILEAFTVTAEREGQSAAVQRQRQSDVMKNVVAADAFGNLIDTNPGEFLKNLPGIFVDYSGEDVSTYSIRGISSDEGTISIDGNAFANSGGENNRGVNLKMVNVAGLESVEVYKAPPPSSPANANGGVINMITKNAFDQKGRRLDLQTSIGFNTSALNWEPVATGNRTPDRVWSPGFNLYYSEAFFGNRLGISLSTNAYQTYRFNNDYRISSYEYDKPVADLPEAGMTGYSKNIILEEASGRTQKRGISLSVDYKLARHTSLYLKTSYNDSKSLADSSASMTFNTGNGTVHRASSDFNAVEVEDMELSMSVTGPQRYREQAWSVNPGVKHRFGNIRIDYDGYFSRSFIDRDPNSETVSYTSPSGHFVLDNVQSKKGPTIQQLGITSSNDYLNLDNYSGLYVESRDRMYIDEKSGAKANMRMPTSLFGYPMAIQAGVSHNSWSRDRREYRHRYTMDDSNAAAPRYSEFYDPVRKDSWEFKSTPVANWLSSWKVGDYYNENPDMFTLDEIRLADTVHTSSIKLEEDITAGYVMASWQINNLNVMAGVRYEYTDALSCGYYTDKRLDRTDPNYRQWVEGHKTYDNVFPNVQLKYELLPNLIFRAAYTTSIGRPKLEYLIPADSVSSSSSTSTVTVTKKNPSLQPQYSKNYDFGVEYYLPNSGLVSANIFRKEITDYILESERDVTGYPELFSDAFYTSLIEQYPGYSILVTTALNAGEATMEGFELSYRQRLSFLPSFFKNFEVSSSFSYAKPKGDIDIAGLKKKVANAQIKYRAKGWLLQLSYYWCDRYLITSPSVLMDADSSLTIGTDGVYERASNRFDLSINYQFSRNWTVSLDWRNVLAEPIRNREVFGRISRYSEAGTIVNLVLKCKL